MPVVSLSRDEVAGSPQGRGDGLKALQLKAVGGCTPEDLWHACLACQDREMLLGAFTSKAR